MSNWKNGFKEEIEKIILNVFRRNSPLYLTKTGQHKFCSDLVKTLRKHFPTYTFGYGKDFYIEVYGPDPPNTIKIAGIINE